MQLYDSKIKQFENGIVIRKRAPFCHFSETGIDRLNGIGRVHDFANCRRIDKKLHDDILVEYEDVLYRDKFHLNPATIQVVLQAFKIYGMKLTPKKSDENFSDPDDLIFYEVALAKRDDDAYLVTGNQRHYPVRDFIVTPAQMISIIESKN